MNGQIKKYEGVVPVSSLPRPLSRYNMMNMMTGAEKFACSSKRRPSAHACSSSAWKYSTPKYRGIAKDGTKLRIEQDHELSTEV